jgi:putative tryptophan/tyrosine transport system permease protein
MSWVLPLDIGLVMGLILAWPVLGFAGAFRFFNFPDLTLEGSFPTGAAVCGVVLLHGWPVSFAILAAAAVGACLGALTAFIHSRLGVNKFLAGIIVVAISYTADLRIMDAPNLGLIQTPSIFNLVDPLNDEIGINLQVGTILLLASCLAVGCCILLACTKTKGGMRLRVAGSNPVYARSLGISAPAMLMTGLAIANALVAGSGALLAMYQGFSDVGMGQGILILALASMSIGERLVPERHLSIPVFVIISAALGSIVYEVLIAYALRLGLAATDLKLATAVFVLLVIALRVKNRDDGFLEAVR